MTATHRDACLGIQIVDGLLLIHKGFEFEFNV